MRDHRRVHIYAETWITTSDDAAGMTARLVALVLLVGAGALTAMATVELARRVRRKAGPATRAALGRPAPPPWQTGDWACGRCRTINRSGFKRCQRCNGRREEVAMVFAAVDAEPDIIPTEIQAGLGAAVTLEHNDAAHAQGMTGHWRLRVNSVVVGTAATRDGALALLRAVRGADAVLFDPKGAGYATYPLPALIAAFEAPRLPYAGPCPESGSR